MEPGLRFCISSRICGNLSCTVQWPAFSPVCDSLNYLLEKEDLVTVFRLVNNYLDPKGIFIFDFNTAAEYRNPLRKAPIVETDEDDTMIWENFFDEESGDQRMPRVLFFLKGEDDRYDKVEEYHEQMAYSLADMKEALAEARHGIRCSLCGGDEKCADGDNAAHLCNSKGEWKMSDYVIRATAADGAGPRICRNDKDMVEEARRRHDTSPVITAWRLAALMTAAAHDGQHDERRPRYADAEDSGRWTCEEPDGRGGFQWKCQGILSGPPW